MNFNIVRLESGLFFECGDKLDTNQISTNASVVKAERSDILWHCELYVNENLQSAAIALGFDKGLLPLLPFTLFTFSEHYNQPTQAHAVLASLFHSNPSQEQSDLRTTIPHK